MNYELITHNCYADLNVNVRGDAPHNTEIINFATVYFPSVPEETRTNGIVSIVAPADIYYDGIVNFYDFAFFANYWLQDEESADIEPVGGDGIIDYLDICLLAEHWLEDITP